MYIKSMVILSNYLFEIIIFYIFELIHLFLNFKISFQKIVSRGFDYVNRLSVVLVFISISIDVSVLENNKNFQYLPVFF